MTTIIIGTGLAGYNLAKELRKGDTTRKLLLITEDDGHFYSKPQLSAALHNEKTPDSLVITPVETMREQLQAQIRTFTQVMSLDPAAKSIQVQVVGAQDEPETLFYTDLIFAVGAMPKPLLPLNEVSAHYRINNLMDYRHFLSATTEAKHITIIGSGLVGCEFAHDLCKKQVAVTVVTPDPYPLYNLVPAPVGEALQKALEEKGVAFETNIGIAGAEQHEEHVCLLFADGSTLNTHCVLSAIGLSPNVTLAKAANIEVKQGIVVNDFLETSHPHIYALGDCAEIDGVCRQYVAPLLQSARALAQTLMGQPTAVTMPTTAISLKTSHYPVVIFPATGEGAWEFEHYVDGVKALYHDHSGMLTGYVLCGSQAVHRQQYLQKITEKLSLSCA